MLKTSFKWLFALSSTLLSAACSSSAPASVDNPNALKRYDPPLTADPAAMAAALKCPVPFTSSRNPVLLVHGKGVNADINWDSGLAPVLRQNGYDVCTVDLPKNSWADIQVAAQFVVHAVDVMAERSARQVSLVGHSQGVMQMHWAIKWWPRVESLVDEVIGLGGIYHGVNLLDNICALRLCPPSAWQMDYRSAFVAAMLRDDETPGHADYSSIYSMDDTNAVYPIPVLEGARNISVQDICPGRKVAHARLAFDAVSLALVLDALAHEGPADPQRLPPDVCQQEYPAGVNAGEAQYKEGVSALVFLGSLPSAGLITREPELADYARE